MGRKHDSKKLQIPNHKSQRNTLPSDFYKGSMDRVGKFTQEGFSLLNRCFSHCFGLVAKYICFIGIPYEFFGCIDGWSKLTEQPACCSK